jgi:ATP-dependent helicase/nuclease subunit A
MSGPIVVPAELRRHQATASDPAASAWVSANAGSGKTHVLTQRVLRLLLAGAPPAQILGLTFTKAAAANMASRIFRMLSNWTSLGDEALTRAIEETGAARPSAAGLTFARQLFARTIETPGGLKVQTLHAFCERLLRLFPFEANVPAHFRVIDEREAAEAMDMAARRAIESFEASTETAAALALVARETGLFGFDALIAEARRHSETFDAFAGPSGYAAALRRRLGLEPEATTARIETDMLGGDPGRKLREAWAQKLACGKTMDLRLAEKLGAANGRTGADASIRALLDAFFTNKKQRAGEGAARERLLSKETCERCPGLEDDLVREQDRLIPLRERRRAAQTVDRSEALFAVAGVIRAEFARTKAGRGVLDFDDQIALALALVERTSAAWVLRKLDYGLDHLLIDEAQDTSAEQWRIVAALTAELFAGAGARANRRTMFVVGDEKQSIFSFQGAAPEMFAEMRRRFETRHRAAALSFETVPLNFSFRSSPAILAAVDLTFARDEAWRGVAASDEPPPAHQAIRTTMVGLVELWPAIVAPPQPEPENWRAPVDTLQQNAPPAVLASRIADTIAGWLRPESPERVVDDNGAPRPIRPGDVMILVRSRNAFFEAMIRALKTRHVKVAGADRLKLRDHIAVMDLIAAGRAALTPDDDLTLACVLKSPLIGLDEDDLHRLAARRTGSLSDELSDSRDPRTAPAARRVVAWGEQARTLTPYAFYARLLGEEGGRKALLFRLGPDALDPIDEFLALALAHEQSRAPSLAMFLSEVEETDAAIKRDMEAEGDGVRVLTVHASKGLEAPIVFLPDTCGAPDGRHDPKLLRLARLRASDPPLFAWAPKAVEDCETLARARDDRRAAEAGEHRRLLYVAMTRAAQRLIVAGYENANGRQAGCWHDLVRSGLGDSMSPAPASWGNGEVILRFGEALTGDGAGRTTGAAPAFDLPGWLRTRPAPEVATGPIRPSAAGRLRAEGARALEGRLAHALLQTLPGLAPAARSAAALAYIAAHKADLGEEARAAIAASVIATLHAPELTALFGPGSVGEVALAGVLRRPGRADLAYRGRLDRMLATSEAVIIADFKLGRAPARPLVGHVTQLALYRAALQPLYPSKPVHASLVYLDGPQVRRLAVAELEAALDSAFLPRDSRTSAP